MIRPKQLARLGEFHLEEAILDVLLEARHEDHCLGPAEISKRAGVYRERGAHNIMNDAIVQGMLNKLSDQNRVKRCEQLNNRGGWQLTDREFQHRRDDYNE
ncbi:MAG: hypothetical protein OXC63_16250 [Aestuariivita sp.]|nr:hypothetical protein [Aestuariivita sp.]MCY4346499.1 hypothetical protein [Aestuariivita sp.]